MCVDRRLTVRVVAAAAGVVVTALVVAIVLRTGASAYLNAGFTDPGWPTSVTAAMLRLVAISSGAITLGSLVFAAFVTTPQASGVLGVDGYAALESARRWSVVWVIAALAMVPIISANTSGASMDRLLQGRAALELFQASKPATAWLVCAGGALLVVVGTRIGLSWGSVVGLAALASIAIAAPEMAGNPAEGPGHDLSTNAAIVHSIAASAWLGLLWATVAWLVRRRRVGAAGSAPELARYRTSSAICGAALLASGLFLGPILAEPAQLFTTGYGRLLVAKAVTLAGLIPLVLWLRRRCSARFAGSERGMWWLLAGEGAWLLLAFGASVGLAQQPAASFLVRAASENQLLIGYELPDPPSWSTLIELWRFDLILGSTAVLLAVTYLLGVLRLRRRGVRWPPGRTVAWLGGCGLLLVATSSGISTYAEALFSLHMVVHMLLNMWVPVLLVLGGPITLALAALPESDPAGPREWLMWSTSTRLSRWLGHPLVAIAVYVVSLYGLYFTPVFSALVPYHWGHQIMNIYFLAIGYFFFTSIIGIDPGPRPLPHLVRVGALLAVMPFHVLFGVIIFNSRTVLGGIFYRQLTLPWMSDLLADQRVGAVIAWIAGEIPLLLVAVALCVQWARQDAASGGPGSTSAREQLAYEEMLSALSRSRE